MLPRSLGPPPAPGRSLRPRLLSHLAVAASLGLLLGLVASGGIAGARITLGRMACAVVANGVATVVAIVAARETLRRGASPSVLLAQGFGAVAGIAVVHALLCTQALRAFPWLAESPAQLMNDAVAVSGLLVLAWACARNLDARLLIAALLGITAYRLTSSTWHLDHAPRPFAVPVQQLVVAQLVAAALALGVWRVLSRAAPEAPG